MNEEKHRTIYKFCRGFLYGYAAIAALVLFEQTSITIQVVTAACACNVLWNHVAKWHTL